MSSNMGRSLMLNHIWCHALTAIFLAAGVPCLPHQSHPSPCTLHADKGTFRLPSRKRTASSALQVRGGQRFSLSRSPSHFCQSQPLLYLRISFTASASPLYFKINPDWSIYSHWSFAWQTETSNNPEREGKGSRLLGSYLI